MEDMSQLQMEAILMFISDLLDDEKKEEAESMLRMIRDSDPEPFALKLAHCLAHPMSRQDDVTRYACAQLLRKFFIGSEDEEGDDEQYLFIWHCLSVSTQSAIKCILLDSMKLEESRYIMGELRYTVYNLAIISDNNNDNWPQLFPFLFQSLTHSTSNMILLKSAVFFIFAGLAYCKGKTMVDCVKPLHPLFLNTLKDYTLDLDLRIDATKAAINFIVFVPVSSNEKHKFGKLLPGMMRTLTDTLTNGDKAEGVLDFFNILAKEDPKFFRWQLRDVVFSMLEIAEDEKLETKTRHQAIEFVLTLVEAREKAPGMMKKVPLFTQTCFQLLLKMLLDIEDDPSGHSANGDRNGPSHTDNYKFGRLCLYRFSIALGGKTIAHVAMEQLGDYLVAPEWEKRHAALEALVQI